MKILRRVVSLVNTRILGNQPGSINVDHERKVIFVHNPKCAGTSLKAALGFDVNGADHRYPEDYVTKAEWENYYKICCVREPFSRLLSSYRFHCLSNYDGHYTNRFPDLKEWSFERYFSAISEHQIIGMGLQKRFLLYHESPIEIDFILQFEHMDYSRIPDRYWVSEVEPLNTLKQRKGKSEPIEITKLLFKEIKKFYQDDLTSACWPRK